MFQIRLTGPTTGIKLLALWLCAMATGIASASDARYAIVQMDGAGHGHLIASAPLARGDSVHMQYPAAAGGSACCKRLMASDFTEASSDELLSVDRGQGIRRAGLCTSEEGVHLIERAGASERTHLYRSVGYAIESPTCR